MKDLLFYAVPAMGIVGLLYTLLKFNWVSKQDAGNDRMKEISTYIAEGAMAFLKAEWKILGYFVVIVALLLGFMASKNDSSHWSISISFIIGAVFSATAGCCFYRKGRSYLIRAVKLRFFAIFWPFHPIFANLN